ncbi:response regulator transcription factor [Aquimarina sp. U1-2]|uniref:LytR/AlgR family response regulator transcription factor n=1 Tax=Aquimarina sp. U1-2 TaxID=2823141 RepID=UPI001AEC80F0|nr:LytTR family DNA-binding domain-containing protein [Aquimarina sp. U1-2]MBP2833216.1 response regulator transcription factor [Aquimarina sp. U1-2]
MKNQINCILLDDDPRCLQNLRILIESYCPQLHIVAETTDSDTFLAAVATYQPNLVFTDIEIGTYTAFDILNELDSISFKLIFVSAYDGYALMGYEFDAIDYLLKPVAATQLKKVVAKIMAMDQMSADEIQHNYNTLQKRVFEAPKLSIADAKGIHMVKITDIIYCNGNGNYTTLILAGGNEIVASKNLKYFENKLESYNFLRLHKSYLIQLSHVDFVNKEQGGSVSMSNGSILPISRNYKKELLNRLNVL